MANFTTIKLQANDGTTASPSWVDIGGANTEVRWSDSATQKNIASAGWPAMVRPVTTSIVSYTYAYSADATGDGFYANGGDCPVFNAGNYLFARWNWDNTGTFASAPIFTAYGDSNHNSPSARDGSPQILGGSSDTTGGGNDRSYLKGNAFGRVDSAGAPAAGPANAPAVTDGANGSASPTAGANWLTNFQDLMADIDYISAPFTPAATTADTWSIMFALFTGPAMTPGTLVPLISLKYTWL